MLGLTGMKRNAGKQQDTDEMIAIFKALADPSRLALVKLLADRTKPAKTSGGCTAGSLCVNALAERLQISQPAVSQHLRALRAAGLVRGAKRGPFVHYAVEREQLDRALQALQALLGTTPR
jgi:DNA-binding transcriptional ArsR family regulator